MLDIKLMDKEKVKRAVLGLMYLTMFRESSGYRAWKFHAWEILDELHQEGYIGNPKSKVRSVELTDRGVEMVNLIFAQDFMRARTLVDMERENEELRASVVKLEASLAEAKKLGDQVGSLVADDYKCFYCHETFKTVGACPNEECWCEGHCPHCGSTRITTTC